VDIDKVNHIKTFKSYNEYKSTWYHVDLFILNINKNFSYFVYIKIK
jgi:hypothetical protein